MAITKIYKFITPESKDVNVGDNQPTASNGLYGNYTWYHRLIQGSPTRLVRYREFDSMDADNDVSIALDMIAEEMTGNASKNTIPFEIILDAAFERQIKPSVNTTLNAALRTWCELHDWKHRIFQIARNTIKYGDTFFKRHEQKNKCLEYIHTKNVVGAVVKENDVTDIRGWHINVDNKHLHSQFSSGSMNFNLTNTVGDFGVKEFDRDDIVRFTLNDDMSEESPFGKSILAAVYRAFKHKELLEDALIIYRIQRAPEKRVFYIATGKMHPQKVAQHLEQIRNEIKQKKIPTAHGGKNTVESVYNPHSMSEDYFFSVGADGTGSRVETLPGGQSLGELADLDYFYAKLWRGLRIPQSYIASNAEGGQPFNDGKVGIAYLQEIKFSLYIERLQSFIEKTFDIEFKRFLRENNIVIDPSIFKIKLPPPSNFAKSREQEMEAALLNSYSTADGISAFAKRFALKKFMKLSDSEIIENERLKREEMGLNPYGDSRDLPKIYNPDAAEAGGFEGGLGNVQSTPSSNPSIGGDEDTELDMDLDSMNNTENDIEQTPDVGDKNQPPSKNTNQPSKIK